MRRNTAILTLTLLLAGALLVPAQDRQRGAASPAPPAPAADAGVATSQPAPPAPKLTTDAQRKSYLMGLEYGIRVRQQQQRGMDINPQALLWGLMDAWGERRLLDRDQVIETRAQLRAEIAQMQAAVKAELDAQGETNWAAGKAFMARNAEKAGVLKLDSGLQVEVIRRGTGVMPKDGDLVEVNLIGWFIDKRQFIKPKDQPTEFKIGHRSMPKGITEGLKRMRVGAIHKLYIPPDLGMGKDTSTGVPPQSTLIFEIELLGIVKDEAAQKKP